MKLTEQQAVRKLQSLNRAEVNELCALAQGWNKNTNFKYPRWSKDGQDIIMVLNYEPDIDLVQAFNLMVKFKVQLSFFKNHVWDKSNTHLSSRPLSETSILITELVAIKQLMKSEKIEFKDNNDGTIDIPSISLIAENNKHTAKLGESIFCDKRGNTMISSENLDGYEKIGTIVSNDTNGLNKRKQP